MHRPAYQNNNHYHYPKYHYQVHDQRVTGSDSFIKSRQYRNRSNHSSKSNIDREFVSFGDITLNNSSLDYMQVTKKNQLKLKEKDSPKHIDYEKSHIYRKYHKSDYKHLRHQRMSTQPNSNFVYREIQDKQSQLRKQNQQKINNIQRINDKIKKILQTLTDQEKKISSNQYKIKKKGYMGRIKTQGNYQSPISRVYSQTPNHDHHYKSRNSLINYKKDDDQSKSINNQDNVYCRLKNIKDKYEYSWDTQYKAYKEGQYTQLEPPKRQYLGQISNQIQNRSQNKVYEIVDGRKISFQDFVQCSTSVIEPVQKNVPNFGSHQKDNNIKQIKQNNEKLKDGDILSKTNNKKSEKKLHLFTPDKAKFYRQSNSIETRSIKDTEQKHYDEKIQKIQQRIQQYQNIKKSIGLQPSPNQQNIRNMMKMSRSRSRSTYNKQVQKSKVSIFPKPEDVDVNNRNQVTSNPSKATGRFQSNISSQNKYLSQQTNSDLDISIPKPFKISKKSTKRDVNQSNIFESHFVSEQRFSTHNSDIKYLRKSNLLGQSLNKTNSIEQKADKQAIKNLIHKLCLQIQYDGQFRDIKKWFTKKSSPYKWLELRKCIESKAQNLRFQDNTTKQLYSILTDQQQIKTIFTMLEQEDNPFYTQRQQDGASYQNLINAYLQSQNYWKQEIRHKFSYKQISFINRQIDIDRKSYIVVEDLVRYINIQSDLYYRNRDIYLIFKRFWHKKPIQGIIKISSDDIFQQLCMDFRH